MQMIGVEINETGSKNMTKILIALENIGLGGMKRATTVVGNALAQQHNVVYYSFSDLPPFYTLSADLLVAKRPLTLANDAKPYVKYAEQIQDFINIAREFDVVILAGGLLSSFAAVMKPQLPDTQLIGWMHNNVTTYKSQYYADMQPEFEAGLRALDTVVVLTDYDLAGFKSYNKHAVKIWNPLTITPNGRADLSQHIIAFTARIAIQHKGIDFAVKLASKLPNDWLLAIAGNGLPEDMATFQGLIEKYAAHDKIIYRGGLKDEALRQHYRDASIFLQTSRWEGLPLVLAEAMSFGLPIVAMKNTGSAEVLDGGKYGILVENGDVDGLLAAIQPLLSTQKERQYYANISLQRVEDFEMGPILEQWQALF